MPRISDIPAGLLERVTAGARCVVRPTAIKVIEFSRGIGPDAVTVYAD